MDMFTCKHISKDHNSKSVLRLIKFFSKSMKINTNKRTLKYIKKYNVKIKTNK